MGLARGKKQHDRRQDIAKRDADLDAQAMSRANRAITSPSTASRHHGPV